MSDDGNVETERIELHGGERMRQDAIPRVTHDGKDVVAERPIGGRKGAIVSSDDSFVGRFADGHRKKNRGQALLDGAIFPFKVRTQRRGTVTIRANQRFFYEKERIHVRAKHAHINTDGRIRVNFEETTVATPRRTWTMTTEDIARLIEGEQLRSDKEIDENARAALESFTENEVAENTG